MRNLALAPLLLVALSACSVPKAEALNCGEDQSIFACQAKFSDGKSRSIVFVKKPMPDATVLDEVTTRDDLGNMYCVTLYSNVTATYAAGECGLPVVGQAPLEPTSTSVDPSAFIDGGLACVEGTSVFDCRASYSDGTTRPIRFVDKADPVAKKIDSDPHI
ncbi:MAG: hypothetical protein ACKOIZ_09610, partial [Actinomycetota bacterium]